MTASAPTVGAPAAGPAEEPFDLASLPRPSSAGAPLSAAGLNATATATFLIPSLIAVWNAADAPLWASDVAECAVQSAAPPPQGVLSTLLGQLTQALPLGSALLRAALPASLALGLAGLLTFRAGLALSASRRGAPPHRLHALMAACGALAATLSPTWLQEATHSGGASLGAALGLGALSVGLGGTGSPASAVLLGALLAATLLESVPVFAPVAVALLLFVWLRGARPERSSAVLGVLAGGATLLAGLLPALVAPLVAPLSPSVSGASLRAAHSDALSHAATNLSGTSTGSAAGLLDAAAASASAWVSELGLLHCTAALLGLALGFTRVRRARALPWLCLALTATLFPVSAERRDLMGLHLLGVSSLGVASALGALALAALARSLRRFAAQPVGVLLCALFVAATCAGAEDALRLAQRRNATVVQTWTDEALTSLPPRALVIVGSAPQAARLWNASARGARPDVVIVPLPLLAQGTLASHLLELEPALALLLRELSVTGHPTEQALTTLADTRPLYVDVDPSWEKQLLEHLEPGPFFARFAPHALGRSDRRAALANALAPLDRVLADARRSAPPDRDTLLILRESSQRQLALLDLLGDDEEAASLQERLSAIERDLNEPLASLTPPSDAPAPP